MVDVLDAARAPVNWDLIDNFRFTNPEHKELLVKNKYIVVGNSGYRKEKYVFSVPMYRHLDLFVNGTKKTQNFHNKFFRF